MLEKSKYTKPEVTQIKESPPVEVLDKIRHSRLEQVNQELKVETDEIKHEKLAKEKRVIEFIDKNLEGQTRIQEPMDPNCEVCLVIPAYGERDYIFRPLESLLEQRGVKPDQFEVIFVVNNPGHEPSQDAKEPQKDYQRKVEHYHKAIEENQQILRLIEFINGQEQDIELTDQELEIVKKLKEKKIRVYAIDKASEGETLPATEANVGGARNRGVAEAVARFYDYKHRNGIIAQTDADTKLGKYYMQSLIKAYSENPQMVGAVGELTFEQTEIADDVFKTASVYAEMQYRYEKILEFVIEGAKKKPEDEEKEALFKKQIHFSGANMSSRAWEAAMVDGVPKLSGGEDPEFGYRLQAIGDIEHISDIQVITADRYSPRTAVWAGHGQQKIKQAELIREKGTVEVFSVQRVKFDRQLRAKFYEAIAQGKTSQKDLSLIMSFQDKSLLSEQELLILSDKLKGIKDLKNLSELPEIKPLALKINQQIEAVMPMQTIEKASDDLIAELCQNEKIKSKYEAITNDLLAKERKWIEQRMARSQKLMEVIYANLPQKLDENGLIEIIAQNAEEISVTPEAIERMTGQRMMLQQLVEVIKEAKNQEEALARMQILFKDEFTLPENDPLKIKSIQLRSLHIACKELMEK